ncbi:MAG: hypothetical protein EOO06_05345 [Chitinophagaceae bacterium]|nr:MAG: hypothetical protein EOO06_05345 [Chitinophagaceae bacterium]
MDGLKLEKWKENFQNELKDVGVEFDAFFKAKKLNEYYSLEMDESDEWSLKLSEELPNEVKERLIQVLLSTKPEDSI